MLATVASTAYVDDLESATSLQAMRQASKNILYTVVNSLAYGENAQDGLAPWMTVLFVVDAVIVLLLAGIEAGAVAADRKARKKEQQS